MFFDHLVKNDAPSSQSLLCDAANWCRHDSINCTRTVNVMNYWFLNFHCQHPHWQRCCFWTLHTCKVQLTLGLSLLFCTITAHSSLCMLDDNFCTCCCPKAVMLTESNYSVTVGTCSVNSRWCYLLLPVVSVGPMIVCYAVLQELLWCKQKQNFDMIPSS
jgi:hypothetical protein